MIDVLSEYIAQGEARGEAKAYRKMGMSDEEIAKMMDKTVGEVKELLRGKGTTLV